MFPTCFLKNALTSKALTGKAVAKKRPSTTTKKSKGFTAEKKAYRPFASNVQKPSKMVDSTTIVPYFMDDTNAPSSIAIVVAQPDAAELMGDNPIVVEEMKEQPDTTDKEGSAFNDHIVGVVSQIPPADRSGSLSSCESYRILRIDGRPMSPSNRLNVVIPVRDTDSSPLSYEGKDLAEAALEASVALSDDESSTAFVKMTPIDREKYKQELFKCFPNPYIKGLRGSSSGHVGYRS